LLGDEPPLNLAAGAARTDCLCRDGRSLEDSPSVEIYGHEYTIDNAADFSNILQPSFITGNDIELVCAIIDLLFKIGKSVTLSLTSTDCLLDRRCRCRRVDACELYFTTMPFPEVSVWRFCSALLVFLYHAGLRSRPFYCKVSFQS